MKRKEGFTLVEIMIVVAIIALLALIAIPSLLKVLAESQKTIVINNIRQIDHAAYRVQMNSNFTGRLDLMKAHIDEMIDSGDIGLMKWPSGAELVYEDGTANVAATVATDVNWDAWLQQDPTNLVVELDGELIRNVKEN